VTRSIILLSALVGGIAIVGTGAANAALVHDLVTFTASNFETDVGSSPAPVDPVTGSFTISFDPTLSYTDETAGITLTPGSLNIALGSTLSFSYNAPTSMLPATTLVVGGISDGAQQVQFNPSTDDFWLFINDFAVTPSFDQVGYSQTAVSSDNLFDSISGGVTVTPFTPGGVPEPSTWAMMLVGFAGIGFLGYRKTVKACLAA
jgi:PEP-CTERM motif